MLGPDELRWWEDEDSLAASITGDGSTVRRTIKMEAGTHFEIANLGWLGVCAGRAVEPDGWLTVDLRRPWLGASVDARLGPRTERLLPEGVEPALIVRDSWGCQHTGHAAVEVINTLPSDTLVETKHTESRNRSQFTKPLPPVYYDCQVRHQLTVTQAPVGLLVARVDAYELHCHVIERDAAWEARLDERCRRFWEEQIRPTFD